MLNIVDIFQKRNSDFKFNTDHKYASDYPEVGSFMTKFFFLMNYSVQTDSYNIVKIKMTGCDPNMSCEDIKI